MQADSEVNQTEPQTAGRRSGTKRTPLPVAQLISTGLIQFSEPITALCIYPFINQFIRETGITGGDEKKTGYYGGIIESAFFFSEALTVVPWGYASDRYGRRPILLLAPLGLTFAMLLFGTSTTFWPLVVARCMQGIFNGNIGVTRSVMAESTDTSNRADAFAIIPLVWSVGSTTASLMGGLLSNPAQRWPDGIGRIPYLRVHPYFLPCAAAGALSFIAFIFSSLLLKETLPSLVEKEKQKQHLNTSLTEESPLLRTDISPSRVRERVDSLGATQAPTNVPRLRDAFIRPIMLSVASNGFLAFSDMLHGALLPLVWSTSIPLGGIGLDPFHIGVTLATFGFINAIIQINCMGPLLRRFGVRRVFRLSVRSLLVCFSMYPLMKFFVQRAGRVDGYVITCMVVQLCCQTMIYFAYGSLQVIIIESVPPGGPMGTANGLAQMASSGSRSVAPTFATSLFALSLQHNLAGGNFVYIVCFSIALLGICGVSFLPEDPPMQADTQT